MNNKPEYTPVTITASDLSLVQDNALNREQCQILLKATPTKYVHERPGKGGDKWSYVTGGYVKKVLNLIFGWDWDFEIVSEQIMQDFVIVKGRLTCRTNGRTIVKMQFGRAEVKYLTEIVKDEKGEVVYETGRNGKYPKRQKTGNYLDIGNDFKAAATDALKKCAAEIGIASDIYNKEEFREVVVLPDDYSEIPEDAIKQLPKASTLDELEILKETWAEDLKDNSAWVALVAQQRNRIKTK